jgi:hypothetical protein
VIKGSYNVWLRARKKKTIKNMMFVMGSLYEALKGEPPIPE